MDRPGLGLGRQPGIHQQRGDLEGWRSPGDALGVGSIQEVLCVQRLDRGEIEGGCTSGR